jgi:hypothetical protein
VIRSVDGPDTGESDAVAWQEKIRRPFVAPKAKAVAVVLDGELEPLLAVPLEANPDRFAAVPNLVQFDIDNEPVDSRIENPEQRADGTTQLLGPVVGARRSDGRQGENRRKRPT